MSQITPIDTESGDAPVIDLASRMSPEARERLAAGARTAVQATENGIADLTTGTIRLDKPSDTPAPAGELVEGVIVQQLEDDDDPRWQNWRLLPAALTDPDVRRHRLRVLTNHAEFHAIRTPVYAWRAVKVTALGAKVAVRDGWSYEQAGEYGAMIDQARRKGMGEDHIAALRAERREVTRERHREPTTVLAASSATSYIAALVAIAEMWGVATAAPVLLPLVLTLFLLGRREIQRRAGDGAVVPGIVLDSAQAAAELLDKPAVLGADSITAAFRRAGLIKETEDVTVIGPVRAAQIHAAEAVIEVPGSLTLSELIKNREKLAKGFRVEPEWLDITSAGRGKVRLWVASQDPFADARPSPLLVAPERTDVWNRGIPIGYNRRGETIYLKLRHVMALLGGMSRTGKGMILRNLICGLGLDPRVNVRLVAGAKPGEHRGYGRICSTFFGRRPERLIALLDVLLEEAYRREKFLEDEGRAKLSERDLDEFPLEILIIDEYKQYAASKIRLPDPSDPEGKRTIKACEWIENQLEELAAFAAALNITVLVSTQDPDANTIPRGYKSNSGARVATRTGGAIQTNAILMDGATGAGLRAHDISEDLKGAAIVDIDGAPGELIRGYFIEDEKYDGAEPLITAGVELRRELGRLPGQFEDPIEERLLEITGASSVAGGPTGAGRPGRPESGPPHLLTLLLDVFEQAGMPEYLRTADVLAGLADLHPADWAAVAAGDSRTAGRRLREAITEALPEGRTLAPVEKSWGRGYLLADVRTAAGIAPK